MPRRKEIWWPSFERSRRWRSTTDPFSVPQVATYLKAIRHSNGGRPRRRDVRAIEFAAQVNRIHVISEILDLEPGINVVPYRLTECDMQLTFGQSFIGARRQPGEMSRVLPVMFKCSGGADSLFRQIGHVVAIADGRFCRFDSRRRRKDSQSIETMDIISRHAECTAICGERLRP